MSNANSNPVSQEVVSFINNINFADPDSLKNSMLTLVNSMIDLRNKNAELVTALKKKQAIPQPQQGLAHPPGQTKPYKGEKFSGETNLEVDEFLRQVKLQCDMDRTSLNMKKLVFLSGIMGRAYQEVCFSKDPQNPFTYTQLKDFLKTRFLDTSKSDKAYREIHTIRQTGGIRGFNKIFSKNVLLIDPRPAEKLLLNTYTTTVKKDLVFHIWTQKPATLADTMTLVEGLEDLIRAHETPAKRISYRGDTTPTTITRSKTEEKTTTSGPATSTRQLSYPATPGTRVTSAQLPSSLNNDQKAFWKRGLCFHCKQKYEPSHAKVCSQRKPRVNNTEDVTEEINEDSEYTNSFSPFQNQLKTKNGSSEMEGALPTPQGCKSMLPSASKFKGSAPVASDTTPVASDTAPSVGAANGTSMLRHEYGYELLKIERSLLLPVTIAGHEAEALVDNSAEIDIISARLVERWKLPLQPIKNLNIGGIQQGQKIGSSTYYVTVLLAMKGIEVKQHAFYVVKGLKHDLILGISWQKAN
jgi:hypothetical protein